MAGAWSRGGADSRRSAAGSRPCAHCKTPVITQLVGQRAALKVTVDAEPLPRAEALALAEPNRLVWCLADLAGGGTELRWGCRRACGHGAVIEHRCPAGMPAAGGRAEGGLW
jgi:hypothetical protein